MSANIEAFLVNILSEYKKVRKKHQGKTWFTYKSWFRRIANCESEYSFLLSEEPKLLHSYKEWMLSDYFKIHGLESDNDIDRAIFCLRSFKDRLAHRNTFLVLIAALFAVGTSLAAVFGEPTWLVINIVFVLALVFERHSLNENVAIVQELAYVLEVSKKSANK